MNNLKASLVNNMSSRRVTYKMINPDLSLHYIYKEKHAINESHRLSFTRFRVSGHNLACETGRWNRRGRGRLPLEERLCSCGGIQTEQHVVQECPLTHDIRQRYNFSQIQHLFSEYIKPELTCKIIHEILTVYD